MTMPRITTLRITGTVDGDTMTIVIRRKVWWRRVAIWIHWHAWKRWRPLTIRIRPSADH